MSHKLPASNRQKNRWWTVVVHLWANVPILLSTLYLILITNYTFSQQVCYFDILYKQVISSWEMCSYYRLIIMLIIMLCHCYIWSNGDPNCTSLPDLPVRSPANRTMHWCCKSDAMMKSEIPITWQPSNCERRAPVTKRNTNTNFALRNHGTVHKKSNSTCN